MWTTIAKLILSASVISFSSWLAGKRPALAGLIIALPLSSLLALAFSQWEWRDPEKSVQFAQSIFVAVPLSLTFFVPFLFAKQLKLPFWGLYGMGLGLLVVSYFVHRAVFSQSA